MLVIGVGWGAMSQLYLDQRSQKIVNLKSCLSNITTYFMTYILCPNTLGGEEVRCPIQGRAS